MPTQIGSRQLRSSSAYCAQKLAKRLAKSWQGRSGRGSGGKGGGGEAGGRGGEGEEGEEEKEEEEEAEEEEENNCDKIKQPSPGRWGIIYCILLLHYALQSLHYILSSDSIGFVLRVQFELKGMRARKHIQHQFGADGSKHL